MKLARCATRKFVTKTKNGVFSSTGENERKIEKTFESDLCLRNHLFLLCDFSLSIYILEITSHHGDFQTRLTGDIRYNNTR